MDRVRGATYTNNSIGTPRQLQRESADHAPNRLEMGA